MQFDFSTYIGKVTRTVSELERDGKPARNVTLERSYDTTIDDLWDAITNPERLPRWFMPVSGDLQLKGRYQFEGNAGGTITECAPPRLVCVTWEMGGGLSWVEVRITSVGAAQSRLALSHICPLDDHWQKYGPGAVGVGWELGLFGLAAYLLGDGFDEEAFASSDAGKAHIVSACDDWSRAAVVAGEDSSSAEAAAKRTAAFYTGESS